MKLNKRLQHIIRVVVHRPSTPLAPPPFFALSFNWGMGAGGGGLCFGSSAGGGGAAGLAGRLITP